MDTTTFDEDFKTLTRNAPFPWQTALYERFIAGDIPKSCNLPTGLGKTSVLAIWLLAWKAKPSLMPRRLVYVVNRRTVVDQTTTEAENLQKNAPQLGIPEPAISTLRGQFADNREWSADPARPAIICGTVDMIGSRLLFSGYGVGYKGKPLHAGFLGQDVLLVHDEAHLEPAFQELLTAIEKEQTRCKEFGKFHVMELTATSREGCQPFSLTEQDYENDTVRKRIGAKKAIVLHPQKDPKKLADQIADLALAHKDSKRAILVFVRTVDDVMKVRDRLEKQKCVTITLTGTMRGKERDGLVDNDTFQRFLSGGKGDDHTVYLVCTSAGEVGVNISADHLVCDLSTFESMAQRFGRVNRFGDRTDTRIDIVHSTAFEDDGYDVARAKTLDLLKKLDGDASPTALGRLDPAERAAAFAPVPTILPTSDILFDAWALTTIKDKLPGRPPVEPYLHGVEDEKLFETHFAWREEVALLTGRVDDEAITDLLGDYPLKPHEHLRVNTFGKGRAYDQLKLIAEREPKMNAWVIEPDGTVKSLTLADIVKQNGNEYAVRLAAHTVVLPPKAGGLTRNGTLEGTAIFSESIRYDVAGMPPAKVEPLIRILASPSDVGITYTLVAPVVNWPNDLRVECDSSAWKTFANKAMDLGLPELKPALRLDFTKGGGDDEEETKSQYLIVQVIKRDPDKKKVPAEWPGLTAHRNGVQGFADAICVNLGLNAEIAKAVSLAAFWHDLGKSRAVWQRGAGNRQGRMLVAKTLHGRAPEELNGFRHELASVVDVVTMEEFEKEFELLTADQKELVLHLIATHHGRGRPHFPAKEGFDQDRPAAIVDAILTEVPGRFAKLQRQYGRWGLAYLESLLRAADALESRRIAVAPIGEAVDEAWPTRSPKLRTFVAQSKPSPTIRINVDVTNPGQFFACCGLLELADRLWPGAEGWFEEREFCVACGGTLRELLSILVMDEPEKVLRLECNGLVVKELIAPLRFSFDGGATNALTLDAWTTIRLDKGKAVVGANPPWNFWSGLQTSHSIWCGLRAVLAEQLSQFDAEDSPAFFSNRVFQKGRFGFDPGPAWNALDIGFSLNEHGIEVESSAAVELLAVIGLQRFRPVVSRDRESFEYATWNTALSPTVAAAAVSGGLSSRNSSWYRGTVVSRGQYAALGYSYPISKGASDE